MNENEAVSGEAMASIESEINRQNERAWRALFKQAATLRSLLCSHP